MIRMRNLKYSVISCHVKTDRKEIIKILHSEYLFYIRTFELYMGSQSQTNTNISHNAYMLFELKQY